MDRINRNIWNKIIKARKLEIEKNELLNRAISCFSDKELGTNLHASNSDNLEETIQCFVQYNEDENKLLDFLEKRSNDNG